MQNPDIKPTKPSYATAEIVEDTICNGVRLTTLKIRYQRMVHAEMLRHRTASRCAASSRAIPIKKMVASANATPIHWGANQVGMQAGAELTGWRLGAAQKVWATAMWFRRKIGVCWVPSRPLPASSCSAGAPVFCSQW